MKILEEISELVQQGRAKIIQDKIIKAIHQGYAPQDILNDGLLYGMSILGAQFKLNEVYVPEVLIASRAMNAGIEILKPYLVKSQYHNIGKVVLGTVEGDLHDIGKNLVKIMLESAGFEVVDLGVDIPIETFIKSLKKEMPQVLAMSALLTTTMLNMNKIIKAIKKEGIRDNLTIIVGGAPITESFAYSIGADLYAADAVSAAEILKQRFSS